MAKEYANTANETDSTGKELQLVLGKPTSAVLPVPGISGAFKQNYHDDGISFWSANTGAHVIYGSIGIEYNNLANETDAHGVKDVQALIGLPISEQGNVLNLTTDLPMARVGTFQNGTILYSASTGAHAVLGAIYSFYEYNDEAEGICGLPTSDETGPLGNRSQKFQNVTLYYNVEGEVNSAPFSS
jgi:hypothetical protein